jgi:cell division protease FtsH
MPAKVSIIPRGRALGGTQQLPGKERHTYPEEFLKDRLVVMLAGRAAEKTLLGAVSSGTDDDIRQAAALARSMVSRWGMPEQIGPVDMRESEEHPFLGREIVQPRRFSEHSAAAVDRAVQELLRAAQARGVALIDGQRPGLDKLIALLESKETLRREEIETCLGAVAQAVPRRAARAARRGAPCGRRRCDQAGPAVSRVAQAGSGVSTGLTRPRRHPGQPTACLCCRV